jgi:hypothetical protein
LSCKGWKQKFAVQDILLCIVASRWGRCFKEGRKYIYEIF